MGYSIYIGEAKLEAGADKTELYAIWSVDKVEKEEAPCFDGDEMTGKTNSRHPGYSQWSDFLKEVGLHILFYNEEDGIMREHPGCFPLNRKHLIEFKEALRRREIDNNKTAGLDERYIKDESTDIPEREETKDYSKVRLIWLIWWTDWALKNCHCPAIYNS